MSILSPSETRTRRAVRRATIDSGLVVLNAHKRPSLGRLTVGGVKSIPDLPETSLIAKFVEAHEEFVAYKNGTKSITVDGQTLSIAGLIATARLPLQSTVVLDDSPRIKKRVDYAQQALLDKVERGVSIYGVSTGFGGSADTRTDRPMVLGQALLEMQHCGVISLPEESSSMLPLSDALTSTSMPESWVRGAILVRMNALIRGHSGVRWELIERMSVLLEKNIVPVVPLRGSISASGDLSPLSYIAGAIIGSPSIRVRYTPPESKSKTERKIVPSSTAFDALCLSPLPSLFPKEHLGILNGTAFSSSVGALALWDSVQMVLGGIICTALGVEAMAGSRGNYVPFVHKEARPHPGQIESASLIAYLLEDSKFAIPPANDDEREGEVHINDDGGKLRQDRYPLRTAPQFLGPQLEDIKAAWDAVSVECNSTTDNPLVEVTETSTLGAPRAKIHNAGNFQAMSITNAMEKTRLSLHHVGRILFAQCAEMVDHRGNRGLPPNLALGDPSLDYCMKGVDISSAAYISELGFLANPVSTHIQSAEMHNQAVNSLALISARQTINSLDTLSILMASYLYVICQALDLRALQLDTYNECERIIREEMSLSITSLAPDVVDRMVTLACETLDKTSGLDLEPRMKKVAKDTCSVIVDWALSQSDLPTGILSSVPTHISRLAARFTDELRRLRLAYAKGERSAAVHLGRTLPVYEFVRKTSKVPMRAWPGFAQSQGTTADTIGENVTRIYEGIRDGGLQDVIVKLFANL